MIFLGSVLLNVHYLRNSGGEKESSHTAIIRKGKYKRFIAVTVSGITFTIFVFFH